jgi:hypothetical protein
MALDCTEKWLNMANLCQDSTQEQNLDKPAFELNKRLSLIVMIVKFAILGNS